MQIPVSYVYFMACCIFFSSSVHLLFPIINTIERSVFEDYMQYRRIEVGIRQKLVP
jgi:hypothetical protein